MKENILQEIDYFKSPVYIIQKPEFLNIVNSVALENIQQKKIDEMYPVLMSMNFSGDSRLNNFSDFILQTAFQIFERQGYRTENLILSFVDMWMQEHHKHSLMEQHVHSNCHMSGFYFIKTPTNCSNIILNDPRPGKVQIDLPEHNIAEPTYASRMIHFVPNPGMLFFCNSWLPHSFGRHASEDPITFIHFDLVAQYTHTQEPQNDAPIII